ncbi:MULTISPECIES: Bug family tripartite tricarboxylate transporter substrate binding protein [Variovorax]|uniref:Bug family tripartite tricarboxylate transporter substrate binding protein n=1 Tax=Variovorax TaxID=34072 RepID=UPI00286129B8|nr:tripartite tricarboxylate transporter substrate binding protein [Variovorax sp. 3319]MDR6889150.1 tripartite-type tricarboxylate transporter receptor subunit TctC [Variovorax sp. 3319]
MNHRRSLLALAMLLPLCGAASAQNFPARPITIVVGSSAGSATDGLARAIGLELTKETGQPVIVDNRAGAFGGIAAQFVARAQPDGYTVFMTTNTTQSANPHLQKKLSYDPIKDFAPVSLLTKGYQLLVVNPQVKANNVAELIAAAKAAPGKLNYGSGSSSAQVATELFQQMTGTRFNYVPYKANPPAVLDLVAGQTELMIADLATTLPHVKAGKLRALGVSSPKRLPLVQGVPAIAESLPGYEFGYWNALYAPAGTPAPVVQRLNALMHRAIQTPAVQKLVEQAGMEAALSTPEELARFQLAELNRWGQIIKTAGIAAE